ncbi:BamA/TamA family outer membrane protein [Chitinophagaceae bacterium LWZ2-11]
MTRKITLIIASLLVIASVNSCAYAQKDTAKKKKKNFTFTAMPLVSFDRSKGFGLGVMAMGFFKMSKDTVTPLSRIGLIAQYTTKHNWFLMSYQQLYLKHDDWRVIAAEGLGNSNFQTYTEQPDIGEIIVPYNTKFDLLYLNVLRRVWNRLYAGASIQYLKATTVFSEQGLPDYSVVQHMNAFGITTQFDQRKNIYNPDNDIYANIRFQANPYWLGNDNAFSKLTADINYYKRLDSTKVLASRMALQIGLGNLPFVGQSYIGGRDIRGYTKGEYRGNQTYTAQTELRWNFYKKWGMVGFVGAGIAIDSSGKSSPVLPGIGAGIRYKVIPKQGINAGIDAAVGKNDWGLYFRITEAF